VHWASVELIFIKMCRLPSVTMTSEGLRVKGVLSRLDKKIVFKPSSSDLTLYWKEISEHPTATNALSTAEERLLLTLADQLRGMRVEGGDALHTKLAEFVKNKQAERKTGWSAQYWSMQHIQVMMAKCVCRAMAEDRPLWLSRLHVPKAKAWTPWLGVFALPPGDDFSRAGVVSFAFTAAETDHEFKDRGAKLARKNTRVTSLEVRFDPRTGSVVPRRWLNGLCFYNNKDQPGEFTIPWPRWMQQTTRQKPCTS